MFRKLLFKLCTTSPITSKQIRGSRLQYSILHITNAQMCKIMCLNESVVCQEMLQLRLMTLLPSFSWWRHQMETFSALLAFWRGALMFSLVCVWINDRVNSREAGDLRRYRAHYDVIVMYVQVSICAIVKDARHVIWYNLFYVFL